MNDHSQTISRLEAEATLALQQNDPTRAATLWRTALELDPDNVRILSAQAQQAFRAGDLQAARAGIARVVALDGRDCQQWINLALACQRLKDEAGEEEALHGALRVDPNDLMALLMRASLLERQGRMHQAATVYGSVARVAPPLERLQPALRTPVSHALHFREKYDRDLGNFVDQYLEPHFKLHSGERLERFRDSLDILVGRKRRFDSVPAIYYYPNLAPTEFFDDAEFPWLAQVEAATDSVREEFLGILHAEEGFTPYLTYPDDVPHFQFAELNNSPRWSAFHIYKDGRLVDENAAKCPRTVSMLDACPQPHQSGRTPTAMFSLLRPKTRIPAHTGVTNARLLTHLPLIVPEHCGFRVGNQTRHWVPGKAWVFDDTIEHEAWNDSEKLRVILIFDIWHPHLSEAERAMISAMAQATQAFTGDTGGYGA